MFLRVFFLAFLFALNIDAAKRAWPETAAARSPIVLQVPVGEPNRLPNDCAILATEANARLAEADVWTRIIFVFFIDPADGRKYGHALTVWQPAGAKQICVYDEHGTVRLTTDSHDPAVIAAELATLTHWKVVDQYFLE